jgi:AAA family ATP:ADP antiporter
MPMPRATKRGDSPSENSSPGQDFCASEKSPIEKFLSLFAEVRPGEGTLLLLLLLNVFLLLVGYYILKPVREELLGGGFLGLSPTNAKIVLTGISAVVLILAVPIYSRLVDRLSRLTLLNVSMSFVIVSLAIFYVLAHADLRIGAAYFLWLSVVNIFLIAQFWSYANDLHSEEAGKRLFATIAVGMAAGAIVGSYVVRSYHGDKLPLLLIAALILSISALLYNVIEPRGHRVEGASPSQETEPEHSLEREAEGKHCGAFALVFRSRYLRLIALLMVLANVVNTTGEFILFGAASKVAEVEHPVSEFEQIIDVAEREETLKEARGRTVRAFYGNFYFWVNLLSLFLQVFIVSRIFKYFGIRVAFLVLPVIALGGYVLIAAVGWVVIVQIAKTAENATDYSVQNTVKQVFYLPTSRDEKYKAKAAIDTFFVRGGDLLAALVTLGLGLGLGLHLRGFAMVNVGFVAVWLLVALAIAKEHKKIAAT